MKPITLLNAVAVLFFCFMNYPTVVYSTHSLLQYNNLPLKTSSKNLEEIGFQNENLDVACL